MRDVAVVMPPLSRADVAATISSESAKVPNARSRVASSGRTSSATDLIAWTLARRTRSAQKSLARRCFPPRAREDSLAQYAVSFASGRELDGVGAGLGAFRWDLLLMLL